MNVSNVLDIFVDPTTHTSIIGQSLCIKTGMADVWLRFPVAMSAEDRAKFLAQLAATATREEQRIVAAAPLVPAQRSAS